MRVLVKSYGSLNIALVFIRSKFLKFSLNMWHPESKVQLHKSLKFIGIWHTTRTGMLMRKHCLPMLHVLQEIYFHLNIRCYCIFIRCHRRLLHLRDQFCQRCLIEINAYLIEISVHLSWQEWKLAAHKYYWLWTAASSFCAPSYLRNSTAWRWVTFFYCSICLLNMECASEINTLSCQAAPRNRCWQEAQGCHITNARGIFRYVVRDSKPIPHSIPSTAAA